MARIFDVIESPDIAANELVRRFPESGSGDFRLGSQLIVREGQAAVFFRDGKALDTFGPGRHTITTANIPLLTGLLSLAFGGNTPFTAEVYFVSVRDMIDQRWGTTEPITLPDSVLGMVRIRSYGTYSFAVTEPQRFVSQVVGARGYYSTKDVTNYLRSMIISRLSSVLGANFSTLLDMPSMFDGVSAAGRTRMQEDFTAIGLTLKQFYIESVSPTEETSKAIDERAAMGAIGDIDKYVKFKTARGIEIAAGTDTGASGAQIGMSLAAGMTAGRAVADSFAQGTAGQPAQGAPGVAGAAAAGAVAAGAAAAAIKCPNCNADNPAAAKFCNSCGQQIGGALKCSNCGVENPVGSKFCNNCGNKF
ncbi:MAG: SPFH domain-containing protein [Chloroflexi bacterium]|nr:SPFH domain-containing protein [Chloroflexota bacterium]